MEIPFKGAKCWKICFSRQFALISRRHVTLPASFIALFLLNMFGQSKLGQDIIHNVGGVEGSTAESRWFPCIVTQASSGMILWSYLAVVLDSVLFLWMCGECFFCFSPKKGLKSNQYNIIHAIKYMIRRDEKWQADKWIKKLQNDSNQCPTTGSNYSLSP